MLYASEASGAALSFVQTAATIATPVMKYCDRACLLVRWFVRCDFLEKYKQARNHGVGAGGRPPGRRQRGKRSA